MDMDVDMATSMADRAAAFGVMHVFRLQPCVLVQHLGRLAALRGGAAPCGVRGGDTAPAAAAAAAAAAAVDVDVAVVTAAAARDCTCTCTRRPTGAGAGAGAAAAADRGRPVRGATWAGAAAWVAAWAWAAAWA